MKKLIMLSLKNHLVLFQTKKKKWSIYLEKFNDVQLNALTHKIMNVGLTHNIKLGI